MVGQCLRRGERAEVAGLGGPGAQLAVLGLVGRRLRGTRFPVGGARVTGCGLLGGLAARVGRLLVGVAVGREDRQAGDSHDDGRDRRSGAQPPAGAVAGAPVRAEVGHRTRGMRRARRALGGLGDGRPRVGVERRERGGHRPVTGCGVGGRDVAERRPGGIHLRRPGHHVRPTPRLLGLVAGQPAVEQRRRQLVAGRVRVGAGGIGVLVARVVGSHGLVVGRSGDAAGFPSRSDSWARPRAMRERTVPGGMSSTRPISV